MKHFGLEEQDVELEKYDRDIQAYVNRENPCKCVEIQVDGVKMIDIGVQGLITQKVMHEDFEQYICFY